MTWDTVFAGELRIEPPLTGADIKRAPQTDAAWIRSHTTGNFITDTERDTIGMAVAAFVGSAPSVVESQLQQIVDAFPDREFTGEVHMTWNRRPDRAPSKFAVRGRKVVRLDAHIGWPPEQADDSEDGLMELLSQHAVYVGDEIDPGDHRNPYPGYRPAEEADLPDALLAWRDAGIQTAVDAALLAERRERDETAAAGQAGFRAQIDAIGWPTVEGSAS